MNKILDFDTFIVENVVKEKVDKTISLYLSHRFIEALNGVEKNNPIRERFLSIIIDIKEGKCNLKTDISFLDVTENGDNISYTNSAKAKPILDKYESMKKLKDGLKICWVTNRQEQRLGRLINKLFKGEFKPKQIEEFVIEFRGSVEKDKTIENFQIVDGEDIKKYYHYSKSSEEAVGSLQHSCMKYNECQKYMNFYIENSDVMKMLILKSPNDDKIYGRANIWFLNEPEGKVFMDRIYTTYEWQNKLFIDYAIRNNWIYKSKQIYGGSVIPVIVNGVKDKLVMSVKLKNMKYDYYPYVDTLQFYNPKTNILTSDIEKFNEKNWLTLVLANGATYQDYASTYKIDYLGRIVHGNYVRWSKYDNVYVHVEDAVSLNYRGDYVTPEHEFVVINGNVCLLEDTEKDSNGVQRMKKEFNI